MLNNHRKMERSFTEHKYYKKKKQFPIKLYQRYGRWIEIDKMGSIEIVQKCKNAHSSNTFLLDYGGGDPDNLNQLKEAIKIAEEVRLG